MASGAARGASAAWTEKEKLALVLSMLKSANYKPSWQDIAIPQGRTLRASKDTFAKMMKEKDEVPMVQGGEVVATPPRKRKRDVQDSTGDDGSEDDPRPRKSRSTKSELSGLGKGPSIKIGAEKEDKQRDSAGEQVAEDLPVKKRGKRGAAKGLAVGKEGAEDAL